MCEGSKLRGNVKRNSEFPSNGLIDSLSLRLALLCSHVEQMSNEFQEWMTLLSLFFASCLQCPSNKYTKVIQTTMISNKMMTASNENNEFLCAYCLHIHMYVWLCLWQARVQMVKCVNSFQIEGDTWRAGVWLLLNRVYKFRMRHFDHWFIAHKTCVKRKSLVSYNYFLRKLWMFQSNKITWNCCHSDRLWYIQLNFKCTRTQ